MEETNLQQVLYRCEESARIGFQIASSQEKQLQNTLLEAQDKVQRTIFDLVNSPYYDPQITEHLEEQLGIIRNEFDRLSITFKEDLLNLKDNLSKFSITIFGRTMAGKSTLMEILREGDGSSIGKGSQRTTREVRHYVWNGLDITDVPGIGAFEGEDDEQIAFEAAKTADLIIFLITDDEPKYIEAEYFSQIVGLGKPVICLVNVKTAISDDKSIKLVLRDINKCFNKEKLSAIRKQFLLFSDQFGQTWNHIPFVYVHLKAAYMAITTEDTEKKDMFYQASRIEDLKDRISELVKAKGEFYRIKTFIDIISNPTLESMEILLEHSRINSLKGRTLVSKRKQLVDWKNSFYRDGIARINSLIKNIRSDLNSEIAIFAEENFDNKNANKEWQNLMRSHKVEEKCKDLVVELKESCDEKLNDVSREVTSELNYIASLEMDNSLRMRRIIDGKKIWNWSSIVISGGLSIAASIAVLVESTLAGPLGIAAFSVMTIGSLGSFLFKSREKKEFEARKRLEKKLKENVEKNCNSLKMQIEHAFNRRIISTIDTFTKEIDKITSIVFQLADTQKELAWKLDDHLLELNSNILEKGSNLIGASTLSNNYSRVARIPGNTSFLLLDDGMSISKEEKEDMHRLMSEIIAYNYDTDNKKVLISRVLGKDIDRDLITIEDKIGVAHINTERLTPKIYNRVRLAQQLSKLLIVNH